jgi:hypothetical protein
MAWYGTTNPGWWAEPGWLPIDEYPKPIVAVGEVESELV